MRIFSKIYRVSHSRERSELICLNCNAQLYGRFCHVCGQENTEPRESLWSIVSHFFNDFTHFDGKFFHTAANLLSKPGFLPLEFIRGRRARYLHPIRLYVFTSAIFFIIFYTFLTPALVSSSPSTPIGASSSSYYHFNPLDSISFRNKSGSYKTFSEYDSVQRALPKEKRDGWLMKKITHIDIERQNKYSGQGDKMFEGIIENFIHTFPYLLFVSLPLSALFLQILYFRNKNNFYAGHAIFVIYLYVFTFLVLLGFFALEGLRVSFNMNWLGLLQFALFIYLGIYSLVAMKRYYAQRWGRTIFKFIAFNILSFFSIMLLFILFFLISLFKV
jgi:hypothetical protein